MNLTKIYHTLRHEPLFCDNDYRTTLLELLQDHAEMPRAEFRAKREGKARSGQELDVEDMRIEDGFAIIPIGGPIGINLGSFEKGAGAVDVDDIRNELEEAADDNDVDDIILNFDTPGGMVTGTPEVARLIAEIDENVKPVWAWSRGSCCSGGYYLASSCRGIFGTPTSQWGNIGVYTTFMDMSQMAQRLGIAVKVISSGAIKGYGQPGTSLTAEQEMFMKEQINFTAQEFFKHIRAQRGQISDADMQGQWYRGKMAVDKGFIDAELNSFQELKQLLRG